MKKYMNQNKKTIQLLNTPEHLNYESKYNLLVAFICGYGEIVKDEGNSESDSNYVQGAKDVLDNILLQIEQLNKR